MTRWVMVADLERCVGCQTCTAACRHTNATSPAVQWRKVLDLEAGTYPDVSRVFVPVGCQHCADPPCMHVCPTTATRQRDDGIVTIDYSLCIGCAYCEVACPYQARFLVHESHFAYGAAMQNEAERDDSERLGVAQKCTFCSDRIDFGLENNLTPGTDPRATPACVNACIATALHFGDIDDPDSNVSLLLREQRSFRMHAELDTEPGFYYLYGKASDPAPEMSTTVDMRGGSSRTQGAEPALQQNWDWKAAGNFICGGLGSGLFVFTAIFSFIYPEIIAVGWAALAIVAFGLFLVFLKIGRPLRAIHVLRQPQRSWMAREAWVAAVFFPLAALALWLSIPSGLNAAAVLAVAFLVSQAMILKEAKGIPAWRTPKIVPLIVTTGLAEGGGVFLAIAAQFPAPRSVVEAAAAAAMVLAALRGWAWRSYLKTLAVDGAPTKTLTACRLSRPWMFSLGLALPLTLAVIGFALPSLGGTLFVLSGLCVTAAGILLKLIIVTVAAFNQGFAITHTPVRGTGRAGGGVKPGWSAA